MELNFAKTAPGVMTASWTHPKKGRQYSIAIIESCDTQHLFIDGELIARELPNFDDAVTLAKQKLNATQSPQLVRIAGALVIASVIGASVVVASKFLPAISPAEIAAAASPISTSNAKTTQLAINLAAPTAIAAKAPASAPAVPEIAASPQKVSAGIIETEAPTSSASIADENIEAEAAGRRRFSARNNLMALEAHLAKERAAVTEETAEAAAPAKPEPPQSAAPAAPVALAKLAASQPGEPATATPLRQRTEAAPEAIVAKPLIRPLVPQTANDGDIETQSALAPEGPPLPAKAPALAEASIKVATHDERAERLASATQPRSTVTANPEAMQPRSTTDRSAAKSRSKYRSKPHSTSRRLPQNERRSPPRRVVTATPQRRLVCFAHVCRWH